MRYLTAGESHGPQLTAIIEGLPAQLPLTAEMINKELKRRQGGHGRGRRMQIETDTVEIVSGVRHGKTLGSPVALVVKNDDWKHWTNVMGIEPIEETDEVKRQLTRPRPGHADLNGGMKYGHRDLRNVLERSSARETTVRVAVGAVAKQLLAELGVKIVSHVTEIGGIKVDPTSYIGKSADEIRAIVEEDAVYCADSSKTKEMTDLIDATKKNGDSIGGTVEVIVEGMPAGIGSYVHYDRKLDAKIAASVMSINAFKGVEFGLGFEMARRPGSEVHDEIIWSEEAGYTRSTNNLGGFEGGMTTGMPIIVRGVMKPIPTLYKPLKSVDIETKEPFQASIERSDSCAVPAASIVAEHVVAFEAANALLEQFDADQLPRLKENIESYKAYTKEF
ncbi:MULTISPECIES: chorismate synthase [unclassified Planococcus (in: firmicutes)]|uniref:chorismate synthase n=1 Tax=unclassified Planococcus (in: firmicutes) TaxID=2662419 RepID=UPI000C339858|nr:MULTISPECIES: chorismate synthase [unclassified Planococcus (in: firmicutes)]AUD14009.1 chorismate synthase [Planococcus sp. MB-3u-03]PKG48005.1 chorismate synthase [Planococcus sp. Urea-trap-24]PKG91853.1 chorismate synthase [Planococcus sp. Urea-3u-39]PKH43243.1 chorismate synthase [Planococcus sp. MB-3u-09]